MKKAIKLIICFVFIITRINNIFGQNLIQNGNFETFNAATCCATSPAYCNPPSEIVNVAFYANCLASTGWYSSHGTADIVSNECINLNPGGSIQERPCSGVNALMVGTSGSGEGIYFDNNLSLSPYTVYTLTVYVWATSGSTQTAYIKLANGLTNGNGTSIPSVQNQTLYSNNFTNTTPQKIVIDFVPNDTYHQLWLYVSNSGSFNVDEIDLRVKAPYSGIDINTAICCSDPVVYNNAVLPMSITGKESITGNNVTASTTSNTVLQAGVFIDFTEDSHLIASSSNTVTASIVTCKPKPFSDGAFSIGSNKTVADCDINNVNTIGASQVQKGVIYSWGSSPATGTQYLGNLSANNTYVIAPFPANTSITYTLYGTNSCGTRGSSMVFTHTGSCDYLRTTNLNDNNTDDINNTEGTTFLVYPNPTNSAFTLSLNFPEKGTTVCNIYNNAGQEVYNETYGILQVLEQNINLQIDSGLYLIKVKHGDKIYQKKIMITK